MIKENPFETHKEKLIDIAKILLKHYEENIDKMIDVPKEHPRHKYIWSIVHDCRNSKSSVYAWSQGVSFDRHNTEPDWEDNMIRILLRFWNLVYTAEYIIEMEAQLKVTQGKYSELEDKVSDMAIYAREEAWYR